jgi:hypothetical protein
MGPSYVGIAISSNGGAGSPTIRSRTSRLGSDASSTRRPQHTRDPRPGRSCTRRPRNTGNPCNSPRRCCTRRSLSCTRRARRARWSCCTLRCNTPRRSCMARRPPCTARSWPRCRSGCRARRRCCSIASRSCRRHRGRDRCTLPAQRSVPQRRRARCSTRRRSCIGPRRERTHSPRRKHRRCTCSCSTGRSAGMGCPPPNKTRWGWRCLPRRPRSWQGRSSRRPRRLPHRQTSHPTRRRLSHGTLRKSRTRPRRAFENRGLPCAYRTRPRSPSSAARGAICVAMAARAGAQSDATASGQMN